jgi:20S proteasome alpha/beta subunit
VTTIVYRDGVLAGDSRTTDEATIYPGATPKVFKNKAGWLYGASGNVAAIERFNEWADALKVRLTKAPGGNFEGILVSPKGAIYFVEGGSAWKLNAPFAATGSGRDAAYGALHFGASALEAVDIAIKIDSGSGLPVTHVSLK